MNRLISVGKLLFSSGTWSNERGINFAINQYLLAQNDLQSIPHNKVPEVTSLPCIPASYLHFHKVKKCMVWPGQAEFEEQALHL